jgi:hypothetical protein
MLNLTREERFDRFTRIAQYTFNTPIAVITLLDNGHCECRQTVVSRKEIRSYYD